MWRLLLASCLLGLFVHLAHGEDGNKLSYLQDPIDPYYVHGDFPKLTTPQWVGEDVVDAVVVLAIDDMRDIGKYEAYLRPILERLKRIDGRAPVSIMTNQVEATDPRLQTWLKEGLSLEVHTIDHPCPCLTDGDLAKAKSTYDRCVELLNRIPNNRAVAFRMPCCDSKNTPSPRFWTEIFGKTTPAGNFLAIDSSVFCITTSADAALPRQLVVDGSGRPRFRKYLPFSSFVNTIEDYPYPYVIGSTCWEFPCVVPSDWEAQNLHQPNNPQTVEDLKAALDAVVIKQGVYNLVFHPHGWIRAQQIVELIDHAVATYGKRVKFLNFRDAHARINEHLLQGRPIRSDTASATPRLFDVDNDGYLDVWVRDGTHAHTRIWRPRNRTWTESRQPWPYIDVRFALHGPDTAASALAISSEGQFVQLRYRDGQWIPAPMQIDSSKLSAKWQAALRDPATLDSYQLRDVDRNGIGEIILAKGEQSLILTSTGHDPTFQPLPWALPAGTRLATHDGGDAGLRFVDVNGDGFDDCVFSDGQRYSLHLFESMESGWSTQVVAARRDGPDDAPIPMIVRPDGTNNGAWFHSNHLWVQNEETARLPDHVDRLEFHEMLRAHRAPPNPKWGGLPGPKSPEASRAAIHTPPGVRVELVAAEPLVVDPIAFDWSPDGRLWVVEMRGYPNGMDGKGEPGGRVKVLEDEDGDGRYDRATVFLDELSFPTGVKSWRKGVLVVAAPEIFYAEDTDGDNVADRQETLYRGFHEGNQQHRVNGLRFGLDGWLYLANGDSGGQVESIRSGKKVGIGGRDLKIRPDEGAIEPIMGQTQYGRNRDDFGHWFGGSNSDPIWHFALEDRYLRRNPHYAPPGSTKPVPVRPGPAPVFPRSETVERFNDFDRANRFTSACSPIVYRDNLIGDRNSSYTFVCEPVHNLVHREILHSEGASFRSQRVETDQTSEFIASEDNWFRPVMVRTGPDGALWVADMYRLVIEHPEWIPASWQARLDVRAGDDRGRIYRVRDTTRPDDKGLRPAPRLDQLSTRELVEALDTPNGTRRDMAHQLLLWRKDEKAIQPLRDLAMHGRWPQASIHALYLLRELDALTETLLISAIGREDVQTSRHAMRLGESFLADSDRVGEAIVSLPYGNDAQLDQQAAYSLGFWPDPRAARRLVDIAARHSDDPYVTAAVMSSLTAGNMRLVVQQASKKLDTATHGQLFADLLVQAMLVGDRGVRRIAFELAFGVEDRATYAWRGRTLAGMIRALPDRQRNLGQLPDPLRRRIGEFLREARRQSLDESVSSDQRLAAIGLLGLNEDVVRDDVQVLHQLVSPRHPLTVQLASLAALGRLGDAKTPLHLLRGIGSYSPRVRSRIMEAILSRDQWTYQAMRALERKEVSEDLFDARQRQRLLGHSDASIRKLAKEQLSRQTLPTRADVVARFSDMDPRAGSAAQGAKVFQKSCATCHRWGDVGHAVGPDLAALSSKSPDVLLTAILDPNRSLETPYIDYTVVTIDGLRYSGIVASETASSVTLLSPDGKRQTILRKDIELFQSTSRSLMPEGMEKDLSREDLGHLLAFLGSRPETPKRFPGNEPQSAPVRDDGSIRLFAIHAQIYGPTLAFEAKHSNLGFWRSVGDRAVWRLEPNRPGKYRLQIDYACDDQSSGNSFLISVADQTLSGRIVGTGSWDDYRRLTVGEVDLPEGESELVFRSAGPIQSYLVDLRTIFLEPAD